MSIIHTNRAAWLGGLWLCLALARTVSAGEPAASLMLPQRADVDAGPGVSSPSTNFPSNRDVTAQSVAPVDPNNNSTGSLRIQNDPDRSAESGFKKPADPLNVGGAWRWLTGSERPGGPSIKRADSEIEMDHSGDMARFHQRQSVIVAAPAVMPPVGAFGQSPAWQWYGYGAPVPGKNPYAPEGVYSAVNPSWYLQSGTTPGAIPGVPMPQIPATPSAQPDREPPMAPTQPEKKPMPSPLPAPKTVEPPELGGLPSREYTPAGIQAPITQVSGTVMAATIEQPAAVIELPVPHVDDSRVVPPPPAVPITRGQAPEPAVPDRLLVAVRLACTGFADKVEINPKDETHIGLRLSVAAGASADRLADKLAALPELSGYDIEMQFIR